MITRFDNFLKEGLIPNAHNLTYSEVVDLYKLDSKIKDYFMEKYPTTDIKILGRYGHSMGESALNRILKFAKKNNDKILLDLVNSHLDYISNFVKDPESYRAAKKIEDTAKKYNL